MITAATMLILTMSLTGAGTATSLSPAAVMDSTGIAVATDAVIPDDDGHVVEHVEVPVRDESGETVLRGHVVRPAGSGEKQRVPVVLWSTPYANLLDAEVHDTTTAGVQGRAAVVPTKDLVARGYAVAQFHVRGTGHSGGCFDMFGPREQADQAKLVEWAASQDWSNGRVGMIGQSADAQTALAAAIAAPSALRTIVVSGVFTDFFTSVYSPQGAVMEDQYWLAGGPFSAAVSAVPPRPTGMDPGEGLAAPRPYTDWAAGLSARYCPGAREALTTLSVDPFAANRNSTFFEERRFFPDLDEVRAAVLLWQGFQDHLAFEEDRVWEALSGAPKRQWQGQWGHVTDPMYENREEILFKWLDHWLKKGSSRPSPAEVKVGLVEYEVNTGAGLNPTGDYGDANTSQRMWRTAKAWPPLEAVEHTWRLTEAGLRAAPDGASRSFRALPDLAQRHPSVDSRTYEPPVGYAPPCRGTVDGVTELTVDGVTELTDDGVTELVYESNAIKEKAVILAGNPKARLTLTSDIPAGSFSLQLFMLGPDFGCGPGKDPSDFRYLTEGGVDLRFVADGPADPWYRGADRYAARDFPTDEKVDVRVDLQSMAERIDVGERIAVVLSLGAVKARVLQGHFPKLTVHGNSGLILPVVEGTLPE